MVSKPGANRLPGSGHKAIAAENPHPRVRFFELPDANAVGHSEEHWSWKRERRQLTSGLPLRCPAAHLSDGRAAFRSGGDSQGARGRTLENRSPTPNADDLNEVGRVTPRAPPSPGNRNGEGIGTKETSAPAQRDSIRSIKSESTRDNVLTPRRKGLIAGTWTRAQCFADLFLPQEPLTGNRLSPACSASLQPSRRRASQRNTTGIRKEEDRESALPAKQPGPSPGCTRIILYKRRSPKQGKSPVHQRQHRATEAKRDPSHCLSIEYTRHRKQKPQLTPTRISRSPIRAHGQPGAQIFAGCSKASSDPS